MSDFTRPVEELTAAAKEYADLRVDDLKLRTAKGLSVTAAKLVGLILILGVVTVLLLVLSFGFVLLAGEWLGSYAGAAFIVAAVLAVLLLVLLALRNRLFRGTFVSMFVKLFFSDDEDE